MRFDDRLTTVLSQPVGSPHDRAVRWRQLVDLVARSGGQVDLPLLERALAVIRSDSRAVREPIRAAAARSIAGSPLPLALLTLFAADKLAVAAPLIASASLTGDALASLRAGASADVRRFLDSLNPPPPPAIELTPPPPPPPPAAPPPVEEPDSEPAPEPEPEPEPVPEPEPAPTIVAEPVPSISEVVARIERLRSSRAQLPAHALPLPMPDPLPRGGDYPVPGLFRWECGPGGEIEWVEGAPRGPLIGRSIAIADSEEGVDQSC